MTSITLGLIGMILPDAVQSRLAEIRRKRWLGFNVEDKINYIGGSDTGYDWISERGLVEDATGTYEVCMPNPFGSFFIRTLRPLGDRAFNEGYVQYESIKESVAREVETLHLLRGNGFFVAEPRMGKADEWGLKDCLVREYLPEAVPLARLYDERDERVHCLMLCSMRRI